MLVVAELSCFFRQCRLVSTPLAVRKMKQKQSQQETLLLEDLCKCLRKLPQLWSPHDWAAGLFDVTMLTAALILRDSLCLAA